MHESLEHQLRLLVRRGVQIKFLPQPETGESVGCFLHTNAPGNVGARYGGPTHRRGGITLFGASRSVEGALQEALADGVMEAAEARHTVNRLRAQRDRAEWGGHPWDDDDGPQLSPSEDPSEEESTPSPFDEMVQQLIAPENQATLRDLLAQTLITGMTLSGGTSQLDVAFQGMWHGIQMVMGPLPDSVQSCLAAALQGALDALLTEGRVVWVGPSTLALVLDQQAVETEAQGDAEGPAGAEPFPPPVAEDVDAAADVDADADADADAGADAEPTHGEGPALDPQFEG